MQFTPTITSIRSPLMIGSVNEVRPEVKRVRRGEIREERAQSLSDSVRLETYKQLREQFLYADHFPDLMVQTYEKIINLFNVQIHTTFQKINSTIETKATIQRWKVSLSQLITSPLGECLDRCEKLISEETKRIHEMRNSVKKETFEESQAFIESRLPHYQEEYKQISHTCFTSHMTRNTSDLLQDQVWGWTEINEFNAVDHSLQNLDSHLREIQKEGFYRAKKRFIDNFLQKVVAPDKPDFLFRRIEKIWQSYLPFLQVPDDKNTKGRSIFLENRESWSVIRALYEELEVCIIREIVVQLRHFQVSRQEKYFTLASEYYKLLSHSIHKALPMTFDNNHEVLQLFIDRLNQYITTGPLRPHINWGDFCNDELKWFFYVIKEPGSRRIRGYILGSIHTVSKHLAKLPKHIQQAFLQSSILMPEITAEHSDVAKLRQEFEDMNQAATQREGEEMVCLDWQYILRAMELGKRIIPLETDAIYAQSVKLVEAHHFSMISEPHYEESRQKKLRERTIALNTAIRSGDAQSIRPFVFMFERGVVLRKEKSHFNERNLMQANTINQVLRERSQETPFIIVGAGHLLDFGRSITGIITLLTSKGWTIEPLVI